MNVKQAKAFEHLFPVHEDPNIIKGLPEQTARAYGFLDALDQIKATGVLESGEAFLRLMSPGGHLHFDAKGFLSKDVAEHCQECLFKKALAKLKDLLGEQ